MFRRSAAGLDLLPPVFGGATRQASVRAGLEALPPHKPDIVLIHDAARPFASAALIVARDRGGGKDRRGDPGAAGDRYRQDRRRRRLGRQDARPQLAAAGADAAKLRLPRPARGASPRRRGRPRGFHRRCRARRMGRHESQRVCRRARQHQDHQRGRFRARRSDAICGARRRAHRHRHRRARLRPRRSRHPRRHPHRASRRRSPAIPTPTSRCMR